jgi:hypothetical protein
VFGNKGEMICCKKDVTNFGKSKQETLGKWEVALDSEKSPRIVGEHLLKENARGSPCRFSWHSPVLRKI